MQKVSQKENSNRKTTKEKEMMVEDITELLNDNSIDWNELPVTLYTFFFNLLHDLKEKNSELEDTLYDLYQACAEDLDVNPAVLSLKKDVYGKAYATIFSRQYDL
jgi:hypothetical protein